jgi:ketosteroid isomerase-like protein
MRVDIVSLARQAYEPLNDLQRERPRRSDDYRSYLDLLDDDVVLKFGIPEGTPIEGEYRGRPAVTRFFGTTFGRLIDDVRAVEPLEYIGAGSKVVILGRESYRIVKTGTVVENKAFAVELEFKDGLIVQDTQIRDLMEFVDIHRHG